MCPLSFTRDILIGWPSEGAYTQTSLWLNQPVGQNAFKILQGTTKNSDISPLALFNLLWCSQWGWYSCNLRMTCTFSMFLVGLSDYTAIPKLSQSTCLSYARVLNQVHCLGISQPVAKTESFMNKGRTWNLRSRKTLPVFKVDYRLVCKPVGALNASWASGVPQGFLKRRLS